MTENALTIRPQSAMEEWEIDKQWGEYAFRTGVAKSPYEGALKRTAARELGITSIAALNGLHVIDGKPSQSPALVWGQILKHPEFDGYEEKRLTDANGAFYGWDITLKRKNRVAATRRFTMDDAKRIVYNKQGDVLANKDNYKNYPENVIYWRAMGFCQDVVWGDLTMGIKRADELGAEIDMSGNVIAPTSQWVIENGQTYQNEAQAPTVPLKQPRIPDYGISLTRLMEIASQEEILEANGGAFPLPNQVNEVVHTLVTTGKVVLDEKPAES